MKANRLRWNPAACAALTMTWALAALLLAVCGFTAEVPYTYDAATNTYTVYTADGLLAWNKAARSDLSLNCTLAADIDLTGISYEWTPVGDYDNPYTGTFEGSDHTITGLTVNQSETDCVGLIGSLGSGGKVQNLTLEKMNITGRYDVGGVVGFNRDGIVTACYWSGYEGDGIGDNTNGTVDVTKVDGNTVTWETAVGFMNSAIGTWNSENTDNRCDWKYKLTGSLPTLTKNE